MSVRSMPAMRVRTRTLTMADVNIACAAMTVPRPEAELRWRRPAAGYASTGLTRSNAVTAKMSVAMPMTMPGTMIAM